MASLLTIGVAVAAVFVLIAGWVLVDQWARRRLGERSRCCRSFEREGAESCCGKHREAPRGEGDDAACPHAGGDVTPPD